MRINYRISDIEPYINWVYFFHAWSVPQSSEEGTRLYAEAKKMLRHLQQYLKIKAVAEVFPAWSEGDDIVVQKTFLCECGQRHATGSPVRIPMLRQQKPGNDGYCLCLSDFIRPAPRLQLAIKDNAGGCTHMPPVYIDKIGVFAVSANLDINRSFGNDDYNKMLVQTLADRLAEAGAERLHEEIRTRIWGYAPQEKLSIADMHMERFQGIRPAVGYPCLPDVSVNFIIDDLLGFKSIGVTLTEHGMMNPHASVSGFMISHPKARYFSVGSIDDEQLHDYASRRRLKYEVIKKYISCYSD